LSSAGAIIYTFINKRKKEKLLDEKEKVLEIEKRKNAEIELEAKKRELTSEILQLAKKNEFFATLQTEVEDLKINIDGTVNMASQKVSKLINRDAVDEKQWEQFSLEFGSLHQGFLDVLVEKHGRFSKGEIKFISLLKMNLSSKDIADTLNASADGVKKARYRLRKKMNLEEDSLQGYLLNFS
jgi:hypothetical protein